ncbi:hypothetical protein ADUPG1_001771 [Aduncisulcus paluster]|uniref:Senescence-associated protein n=1 Tax=Aduncisulcus paluster TaxID=2918883 RepID=A0ABQ5KEM3_9EUKA|nr:hypothetical protein ADUPG1_001771 [Aduncisulcus paluster]
MISGLEAFSRTSNQDSHAASRHCLIKQPLTQEDKTNLSHDGLNPAHVPFKWVNNPTLAVLCYCGIGRADIEESKGNVAMNAWLPQASYPCGNFSDISSLENL